MSSSTRPLQRFGIYEMDRAARTLRREGALVPLPPKVFDVLVVLVDSQGTVVEKAELMQRLWPDTFVEDGNLPVAVFALRRALGQPGEQYIRTVPRRGYCFTAPITSVDASPERSSSVDPMAAGERPSSTAPADHLALRRDGRLAWQSAVLIACAAALGVTALVLWRSRPASADLARVQSLAVLPFTTAGASTPDGDTVSAGLSASIATRLIGLDDVIVRPFASGLKFGGPSQDAVEAGEWLRVDAVLTGSVRVLGTNMQVASTLIRVADDARLWSYSATVPAAELARAEATIVERLARALEPDEAAADVAQVQRRRSSNGGAYDAYLRARAATGTWTVREVARAVEYYDDSVRSDPEFADALAGLAAVLVLPPTTALSRDALARAKESAGRALAINPALPEAQSAWGRAALLGEWDWAGAERAFRAGIGVAPYDAEPRVWYAQWLSAQGRHDEALAEIRLAQDIDPTSPRVNLYVGTLLLAARRYEEGAAQLRKTPLEMGVVNQQVYLAAAVAHAKRRRWDEALAIVERMMRMASNGPARAYHAYVLAEAGRDSEADSALAHLSREADTRRTPHIVLAAAYACRGRMDDAFARLQRAHDERDPRLLFLKVDPMLDCARSDARFAAAVRRIGLEP